VDHIVSAKVAATEGDDCEVGALALQLALERDAQIAEKWVTQGAMADKARTLDGVRGHFVEVCREHRERAPQCAAAIVDYADALWERDEWRRHCIERGSQRVHDRRCDSMEAIDQHFGERTKACRGDIEGWLDAARDKVPESPS
jgi:hypothetical protein